MLTIGCNEAVFNCEGSSRREFLRIGALGLGGLTLTDLLTLKAKAGEDKAHGFLRDKSVVMLNLQGGPTHVETFDPKMTAPSEYRAMFGEVKTSLPGVTFGSHFPMLGKLAHKMAVVRSFRHGNGSHGSAAALVAAGGNPTGACMGSLYSRVAGLTNAQTGLPSNCLVVPATAGDQYKDLRAVPERITSAGTLPQSCVPFDPSKGGAILNDMEMRLPQGRFENRRGLLSRIDELKRAADATLTSADSLHQKAFDVILGGVTDAFDLSKEDPRTLERYDTGMYKIPKGLSKKKKNGKSIPGFSPIALGKQMLMARKLCETGCGFVTVTSTGWDMHGNAFGIDDGMPILGPAVDKAASAFIEDCADRGLSDKILLVITGEFGRTPKINSKGGRDHWGNLCTLAFAGGGLNMGQVVGKSDKLVGQPAEDLVTTNMLLGTVMNVLFDPGQVRLLSSIPDEVKKAVVDSKPIPQLV
jgi:hypothetical protein